MQGWILKPSDLNLLMACNVIEILPEVESFAVNFRAMALSTDQKARFEH